MYEIGWKQKSEIFSTPTVLQALLFNLFLLFSLALFLVCICRIQKVMQKKAYSLLYIPDENKHYAGWCMNPACCYVISVCATCWPCSDLHSSIRRQMQAYQLLMSRSHVIKGLRGSMVPCMFVLLCSFSSLMISLFIQMYNLFKHDLLVKASVR